MNHASYLNNAHFSGVFYMCAAASAHIPSRHLHNTYQTGQFLFASVLHGPEFFLSGIKNLHRDIGIDQLVGLVLQPFQFLRLNDAVKVHRHLLGPHVKAHIIVTKVSVHQAGQNMLPGVQLHVVIPPLPVYDSLCQRPLLYGLRQFMDYLLPLLMDGHHGNPV